MRRARAGAVVAAIAAIGCSTGLGMQPAHASGNSPYSANASASAMRLSVHDPEIVPMLTGGGFDVDTPLAQAVGDNLGGGRSVASVLYPGDDVAGISAVIAQAAPAGTPMPDLPPWPVTVIAQPGKPHPAPQSSPLYDLKADIGDGTASAETVGGVPAAQADNFHSTATALPTKGGGVQATATATAGLASVGDLLKVGTIKTTATATRDGQGKLTRSSSIEITGASIAGLPLGIKDGKLEVPVLGGMLPLDDAIAKLPLLAPIKQQGFELGIEPAQDTPTGIIAPHFTLSWQVKTAALPLPVVDLPNMLPAQPEIGPIPPSTFTATLVLGNAEADATLTPLPDFNVPFPPTVGVTDPGLPSSAPPPVTQPSTGGVSSVPGPTGTGNVDAGVPVDTGDAGGADTGGSTVPVDTGQAPAAAQPVAQQPVAQARQASYRIKAASFKGGTFYLVFLIIGAAALGAAQLVRFRGVKTSWTS